MGRAGEPLRRALIDAHITGGTDGYYDCSLNVGWRIRFVVSTLIVVMQMRKTQDWNTKKTSEELLTQIMIGEFPKLMDSLLVEYDWDILAHVPYAARIVAMEEPRLRQMDVVLRNVLRNLEVVCINMKHKIIDEKVCYEYLHSIVTTFYVNSADFIAKERTRRKEPRVFLELEEYAKKWLHQAPGAPPAAG